MIRLPSMAAFVGTGIIVVAVVALVNNVRFLRELTAQRTA